VPLGEDTHSTLGDAAAYTELVQDGMVLEGGPSPGKPKMAVKLRASLRQPAIAGLQRGEVLPEPPVIPDCLTAR
jgi:hypothetical protein